MVTREEIREVVVKAVEEFTGISSVEDGTQLDVSDALMVLGECGHQLNISLYIMDELRDPMTVGEIVKECETAPW